MHRQPDQILNTWLAEGHVISNNVEFEHKKFKLSDS